jgi:putative ubiquitin-RnfH superfamily antitoxin RatB of RatAB toxin-antitoxin module
MDQNKEINIEVVFAIPTQAFIIPCTVLSNSTIYDAIIASGILALVPELQSQNFNVGIFNKVKKLTDRVQAGDRIEIYRPLVADPKELRRAKAKRQR